MLRKIILNIFRFLIDNKKTDFFFSNKNSWHKNVSIGDYTYGIPEVQFVDQAKLKIGKYCSIAGGVKIMLGGNHRTDWISTYPFGEIKYFGLNNPIGHPATKGDVIIKNDVWIGNDVLIMSGVTVGNGAVIGARSVVTKDIGDYEIWAGNPARYIKKRFSENEIEYLLNIEWWNWEPEMVKKNIMLLNSNKINSLLKKNDEIFQK